MYNNRRSGERSSYPRQSHPSKYYKAFEMLNNPTPSERQMWNILTGMVIAYFPSHPFYVQAVMYGYILDFYCPSLQLGIEVDGSSHNSKRGYDYQRDSNLAKRGIQVIRFANSDTFNNPQYVGSTIYQIALSRASQFIPPVRHTNEGAIVAIGICTQCGAMVYEGYVFCESCGRKL